MEKRLFSVAVVWLLLLSLKAHGFGIFNSYLGIMFNTLAKHSSGEISEYIPRWLPLNPTVPPGALNRKRAAYVFLTFALAGSLLQD